MQSTLSSNSFWKMIRLQFTLTPHRHNITFHPPNSSHNYFSCVSSWIRYVYVEYTFRISIKNSHTFSLHPTTLTAQLLNGLYMLFCIIPPGKNKLKTYVGWIVCGWLGTKVRVFHWDLDFLGNGIDSLKSQSLLPPMDQQN